MDRLWVTGHGLMDASAATTVSISGVIVRGGQRLASGVPRATGAPLHGALGADSPLFPTSEAPRRVGVELTTSTISGPV